MSDLRLINQKNNRVIKKLRLDKHQLIEMIEEASEELIGISIIASNFSLSEDLFDKVETLGYDENCQLTIIEYRVGKFNSTLSKGLVFLDYIKNNYSKIKSILNERLGYELANNIVLNPRLISLGDDYNQYDEFAIKKMSFSIDLIKYQSFDNKLLLLEKNYQSCKIDKDESAHQFKDQNEYNLYRLISEFILSLGDEVCEVHQSSFIAYRKIKNFMYIIFGEHIEIKIKVNNKYKSIYIKNFKDFEKCQKMIEQCYDEN